MSETVTGSDILLGWNPATASGDWQVVDGAIASVQNGADTLRNAVLISLFTDRTAPPEANVADRRGWWATSYRQREFGSLLWLLARAKITSQTGTLRTARHYCVEALQWLIDDGIAATIDVSCQWAMRSTLAISVAITKPDGSRFTYNWLWQGF